MDLMSRVFSFPCPPVVPQRPTAFRAFPSCSFLVSLCVLCIYCLVASCLPLALSPLPLVFTFPVYLVNSEFFLILQLFG